MKQLDPLPAALVFDFDGTIADTRAVIVSCFQRSYRALGIPAPPADEISATIGIPLERAFHTLSGFSEAESRSAAAVYRELFARAGHSDVRPITGMPDVVRTCHAAGYPLAIASSRSHNSLDLLLDALGLTSFFTIVAGPENAAREKPHPDLLFAVAEHLGICAARLLMIGDTSFDVEMGRNAGCLTLAVTWGNHSREALDAARASAVVDRPQEIPALVGLPG